MTSSRRFSASDVSVGGFGVSMIIVWGETRRPSQRAKIFVGRAPWPAADALVGLFGRGNSRTRGSGADEGVRPTYAALWGGPLGRPTIVRSAEHTSELQ